MAEVSPTSVGLATVVIMPGAVELVLARRALVSLELTARQEEFDGVEVVLQGRRRQT